MRAVSWIPDGCEVSPEVVVERFTDGEHQVDVAFSVPTIRELQTIAAFLRRARSEVLVRRSVDSIIASLDEVATRWLDLSYPPLQSLARDISVLTGFSLPMVLHAIELEQRSSRRQDMEAVLDRELGNRGFLDGFHPSPKGRSMASGPELVGGIFSANIPALPHLTVMRSLLVKSACLGRVSRNEPLYLAAYLSSLAEVDPELATCVAALYWPNDAVELTRTFAAELDHLVAYGSDETLGKIKGLAPPMLPTTCHGHAMSFVYVSADALGSERGQLARRVAYDFSLFDQHACLSPQVCFVERGGAIEPRHFAQEIAQAMSYWLEELPPRRLNAASYARLRVAHDSFDLAHVMTSNGAERMTPTDTLQGQVTFEPTGRFEPVPLERFVRVIPVDGPEDLFAHLRPWTRYLQSAGLTSHDPALTERLARLGVNRICAPGFMGTPTMVWRHDGQSCLERMLEWCDIEVEVPASC